MMVPQQRHLFFDCLRAANPVPQTELSYTNTYQLLVAVVLSAQATDRGVNSATTTLFRHIKTPAAMLRLGEEKLIEHIRTIGLFRSKSRHIIKLSEILVRQHNGEVPATRAALEALPGVGRKTANVVLNTAFGKETIAVDTHVFRVANRTGLAPGKTVRLVEEELDKAVPAAYKRYAHHWLILLGRHTCQARRPHCDACCVREYCAYPDKPT